MAYRVMVVEDEPVNRNFVCEAVRGDPELTLQSECGSVDEAKAQLLSQRPDVVLLDIQLGQDTVFSLLNDEVFQTLSPQPLVVFVTAYDQYAVKAFELSAVDYLLKPFGQSRLKAALQKVKARLRAGQADQQLSQLQDVMRRLAVVPATTAALPERLQVKADGKILLVAITDVAWVGAKGNYVELHTSDATYRMRETLAAMEQRLIPHGFVRTQRSLLVNLNCVLAFEPWFNGDYMVVLSDGERLKLSRRYKRQVGERLGGEL